MRKNARIEYLTAHTLFKGEYRAQGDFMIWLGIAIGCVIGGGIATAFMALFQHHKN